MRILDTDIAAEYQKEFIRQFCMLELIFDSTYRYNETEENIYDSSGNLFLPRSFTFDNINTSSGMAVAELDIVIDNTDQVISAVILNEDVRNRTVKLYIGAVTRPDILVSGSVTQANMRLSAIDGAAFLDFSLAGALTPYAGSTNQITIFDSAGKKLTGYIKDAGTGETYGTEQFYISNSGTYPFDTFTLSGIDITSAIKTKAGVAYASKVLGAYDSQAGKLFKWSNAYTLNSGVAPSLSITDYSWSPKLSPDWNSTTYLTGIAFNPAYNTILFLYTAGITNFSLTNNSLKQVLTPSVTGVTITSTQNGSTYNWTSQESGFNYNDAAGYTYTITSNKLESEIITQEFMRGIVGGWELSEDNKVKITIKNELVLWSKKALRIQSSSCPWAFKGTECAYAGSQTWCDQSYDRCRDLANTDHFGGFRFLPALMEKEIWWGRERSL